MRKDQGLLPFLSPVPVVHPPLTGVEEEAFFGKFSLLDVSQLTSTFLMQDPLGCPCNCLDAEPRP